MLSQAPLSPIGDEPWTAQQAFEDHSNNTADDSSHRIISHQSTSRPGCIIDLMPIEDTYRVGILNYLLIVIIITY